MDIEIEKKMWKDILQDINSCIALGNRIMDAFFFFYIEFFLM